MPGISPCSLLPQSHRPHNAAAAASPFRRPRVGARQSRPGAIHRLATPPPDATGAHVLASEETTATAALTGMLRVASGDGAAGAIMSPALTSAAPRAP